MISVSDYQIIQRDETGNAKVYFCGEIPEDHPKDCTVMCHVVKEDNNLLIAGWNSAEISNGKWSVEYTLPEGGLYRFEAICHSGEGDFEWSPKIKIVSHFGIGDLYMLTGQSNMAGYGRDVAYDPPCLGVHLYANDGTWKLATHPLNDSLNTIYPENRENSSGTSPALSFARYLKNQLNIPIGLVQASLGGSFLSQWNPDEDGTLTKGMLRRIDAVGKICGILWYQGCSDASGDLPLTYLNRFKNTVTYWREQLGNVPILTVQINRWAEDKPENLALSDLNWGRMREAQRQAAMQIDKVYLVPTIDLPVNDCVHNSSLSNVAIGERLANVALKKIYGKSGQTAPNISEVKYIDETHIRLLFEEDHIISAASHIPYGFNIEDENGMLDCVCADYTDHSLVVTAERPFTLPAKFHAMWTCKPPAFLVRDLCGLPMLSCYGVEITK